MNGQSDEFIRDIYSLVLQPVITQKVLPLIDTVTSDVLQSFSPKDKVSVSQFDTTMTKINELILEGLFCSTDELEEDGDNLRITAT